MNPDNPSFRTNKNWQKQHERLVDINNELKLIIRTVNRILDANKKGQLTESHTIDKLNIYLKENS